MAVFGGLMDQAAAQAGRNQQRQRPMDPYKAGGPEGYMARVNRMRMGGRHQPGGDPRQQGGGGKPNRNVVSGNAGGQGMPWAGQQRQPEWGPGGPARTGGLPSKLLAATQGQQGGQTSGKANRQTVPQGATPKQAQAGGRMWAGGSPGWAGGGGRGIVAGGQPGAGGGKPNRQTVPGNANGGGGMIGRGSMRGRNRRGRPPVNPTAKRKQAQRTSARGGTFGGTTASRQRKPTKGGLLAAR